MSANFNYGKVLQKSFLFYEAQRSGELPPDSRITWRGDSAVNDGALNGRDLSGGYYDAGDHVKFVFPMAGAMTMLAWGLIEYKDGYVQSNQYDEALDALKWGTDWLLKAHETDSQGTTAFWMQVGDGDADHSVWALPETLEDPGSPARPAFKLDRQTPGSDVAAEAAAALAAASIVFRPHDESYADELLENAVQLYAFADDADLDASNGLLRGEYSDVLHQLTPSINSNVDDETGELNYYAYYHSWSGYPDELLWGATWLHKAKVAEGGADSSYLAVAEQQYQQTYFNAPWTQTWDDKSQGAGVLLAQITQSQTYRDDVESWLNRWLPPGNENRPTNGVAYSPGGLAWLTNWGSLRASANTAFLAGIYADTVNDPNGDYSQFAQAQIDYMLGDNPNDFSYVVGFGDDSPLQPHHQGASGVEGFGPEFHRNTPNKNVIYGALVGGPRSADDDDYQDVRTDFITNEVALDYNAAFTGAVARLYTIEGGEPLSDEQLANLPELTYKPHLKIMVDDLGSQDLAISHYGGASQNSEASHTNIFLDKGLQIIGNGWRKISLNYDVTTHTRIRFEALSEMPGEIQGIGFDNNNTLNNSDIPYFFQIAGTHNWSPRDLDDYVVEQVGLFTQYEIPVGQFFTGQFKYLTFGNDHDVSNANAAVQFRNIKLFEQPIPPNQLPTTSGLLDVAVLEGTSESIINLHEAFDDAETSDENLQYSITANTNLSLFSDVVITSEGDLVLNYNLEEFGTSSVTVTATDEAGASISSSFEVLVEESTQPGNVFRGDAGSDRLTGTDNEDRIDGLAGNDLLFGLNGNDELYGGEGNDFLRGDGGGDLFNGGAGNDTVRYESSNGGVTVNLLTGEASGFHANGDTFISIENIYGSRHFVDYLTGDNQNNRLDGLRGNDQLFGLDGNDILNGGEGGDLLDGGAKLDWAYYHRSSTGVYINLSTGAAMGGEAEGDILISIELLYGSQFDDTLIGKEGSNTLTGNQGNDTLDGKGGNDVLLGRQGDDTMTGGSGADRFRYSESAFGNDIVTDFADAVDKIDLTGSGLVFGDFSITQQGADTLLSLNSSHSIRLKNVVSTNITGADFLF